MQYGKKRKYDELMEDLRAQILGGTIKPGEKLLSENRLAADYQVSRQTVRKALAILEEEGFVYAEHGRGTFCSKLLRSAKPSRNIAVVMTYLSDYIFPRVIQGIDQVLTDEGYSILLKNTKNSRSVEARCLEELLQKDIDGLIIEPSKSHIFCKHMNLYELLDQKGIPYVFIQGCYAQMEDKPHILLDDCMGGYLVTKYLISLGHRRIIGVFKSDDIQGQERHKGYVRALQEAGLGYDPDRVIWYYTEDRRQHPYQKMRQLARAHGRQPFDAVVAYNDQVAIDVIRALEEEHLFCPQDVSVTGYDDSCLAVTGKVPLTTIAHPQEELGRMAAELLLRILRKEEIMDTQRQVRIMPELVIRESCRGLNGMGGGRAKEHGGGKEIDL